MISSHLSPHSDRHVQELMQWLRIPSISSSPEHDTAVRHAATWVHDKLRRAGLETQCIQTAGFPLIYAHTPFIPNAPVALVYGHYDVQPVTPLHLWQSDPFEPQIREGQIYARGATDDKGQVLTHIHAVCDLIASGRSLPMQVKFLIEGEEEIGSASLESVLPELASKLSCDVVVISDSSQYGVGRPAITCGLRGIATYEMTVDGPGQDLHSGSFGGAVANPVVALCHLLSSIVGRDGLIAIPGFYDEVKPIPPGEAAAWKRLPSDDAAFAASIGVDQLFGETGYTTDERRWGRPTFDINGITAGHQEAGVKTIIPASASAKFSFRLVADQDPVVLTQRLERHLQEHKLPGTRVTLYPDHGAGPMLAHAEGPYTRAAAVAIEAAFGVPPVTIREGGSIPIVAKFQQVLDCDCLLLGWGQNDDGAHSPNEKFTLADFHRGIEASTLLWNAIAEAV